MGKGKLQRKSIGVYSFLLILGIIFVAFNLRPAITSVGPVIGIIRDDLGLSNWSVGIITSLPLVAFAFISPLAPKLANRFSNERALLTGLIILALGIAIRSISIIPLLFLGTLFVGIGIAVCNVLLPGVVKEKFPNKVEIMTGVYSTAMALFASAASGLSIPLTIRLGLGWQIALFLWILPTVIACALWIFLGNDTKAKNGIQTESSYLLRNGLSIWKSALAWQVALFMGFQSFLFYVTISWLPEILITKGIASEVAGWMLSFTQLVGLPLSFLIPVIAGKFKSQWGLVIILGLSGVIGYAGLTFADFSFYFLIISCIFVGIALGGIFPLCLTLLALRARTPNQVADLSGMAQSIGYLLAAVGPIFIGYLFDLTNNWTVPLSVLMVITVIVILFGTLAGRNRYVFDE